MAVTTEYAKIESGVVTAVIVADAGFVAQLAGTWVLTASKVGIGYLYDGNNFSQPA